MNIAFDTNRITDLMRGDVVVNTLMEGAEAVVIPFAVMAELEGGFLAGTQTVRNRRLLATMLAKPSVRVVFPDEETVALYAQVFSSLRSRGRRIPQNDIWIASICLQHRLTLCTRDSDFEHVTGLLRV